MAKEKIAGRVYIDIDKIDKNGIWKSSFKDNNGNTIQKKYLTLDIFVNNKEDKYGKDIYVHQSLGKMKDEDGNDVVDSETGKPVYGKVEYLGKGKTHNVGKKEKAKPEESNYVQQNDNKELPF